MKARDLSKDKYRAIIKAIIVVIVVAPHFIFNIKRPMSQKKKKKKSLTSSCLKTSVIMALVCNSIF